MIDPKSVVSSYLKIAKKIDLSEGMVFKSLDKTGDFANELMFVSKVKNGPLGKSGPWSKHKGPLYYVIFEDGGQDWFSLEELNVDPKSVRKYKPGPENEWDTDEGDPDFYGMDG